MRKVFFMHPKVHNLFQMKEYLHLNEKFLDSLCWEEISPDIVFVSEHIYGNPDYFKKFKQLYNQDRIFVFHGGEAVYPDLNIFDYAIGYFNCLQENDRIIPIPKTYIFSCYNPEIDNEISFKEALQLLNENKGFCSFIYSNAYAHPMRDKFFYELSNYKQVSSLGKHLNNTGQKSNRMDKNWLELSIEQKRKYKFSIAFENAYFPGYISEKLTSSFKAHCVPIYWGDPLVGDYFNTKAFINCHEYASIEDVIKRVREVDEDDSQWAEIVSQPWQNEIQKNRSRSDYDLFRNFMKSIVYTKDINKLRRRPIGTFTDIYYNGWFYRPLHSFEIKIKRKIKRMLKI